MNPTPTPPPCPTPVCTEVVDPVTGAHGISCTSVYCPPVCGPTGPSNECCIAFIPNTSSWEVVCADGPWTAPPPPVPALSDLGIAALVLALAVVGLRKVRA